MSGGWGQHLLFTIDQIAGVEGRQLKSMAVRYRVGRASLDAIATEDAAIVIDVINLGVAFGSGDPFFFCVFCGFDVDAICRARRGTEEACDALFQAIFVALQDVHAAKTLLKHRSLGGAGTVRIIFDDRRLKHFPQGNAHSLGDRSDVFDHGHTSTV